MGAANRQNATLQKQLQELTRTQSDTFKKLQDQQTETNWKLEMEQRRNRELEQELANKSNSTMLFFIVAAIALVVGFILAVLLI